MDPVRGVMLDEWEPRGLAPGETLLGKLQRGWGVGYREALARPAGLVVPLVWECVVHDPRWDQQLEERAGYYARLLIHFEADLAPLEQILSEDDPSEGGERLWLPFDTLEELIRRGRFDALPMLRRYLAHGRHWESAARALVDTDRPEAWSGMLEILLRRFPTGEELAELDWTLSPDQEPGRTWRILCPSLDAAFREQAVERALRPSRESLVAGYEHLSVEQLFARVDRENAWICRRLIPPKVRPEHRRLLREHLDPADRQRFVLAVVGLAGLGQPEDWESFAHLVEADSGQLRSFWGYLVRSAEAFPPERSLPPARRWLASSVPLLAHLARHILAAHAEPEDRERLLAIIEPALEADEMYHVCSALEGLARLPQMGRLPEVERAFEAATYAWTRRDAANAMLVHAPEHFVRTYATECLWDAEPRLRMLAARHADRTLPEVRARMAEMAADPYEDEDVLDLLDDPDAAADFERSG